jgi:hypothetical protein
MAYRCGTSRISILHPTALAYLFREVSDGACLPADSRRETVLFVVPMREATASCVRPARARAASISFATGVLDREGLIRDLEAPALTRLFEESIVIVQNRFVFGFSHGISLD